MVTLIRDPKQLFAPAQVSVDKRPDGSQILRSPMPLGEHAQSIGAYLEQWARDTPEAVFIAERDASGEWVKVTYAQARARVRSVATWLLGQNLSPQRPIAILSDNSIEHALLMLAGMHIGVPVSSMSQAYSLMSRDFAKLKTNIDLLTPGVIFVEDHARFAPALSALAGRHDGVVVAGSRSGENGPFTPFSAMQVPTDDAAVDRALAKVNADTIAKLLFTSGSIGAPKAVINTQRMLCANQQAKSQIWTFLAQNPPIIVDWLPWSHTFGGNHNLNMILRNGGTFYVDAGKPAPGAFDVSQANLREIAPTVYLNVPRGFDLLVSTLQADEALRQNFFSRLQVIFYAAAALPQHLFNAINRLAEDTLGHSVPLVSGWGSTETAPVCTDSHFMTERSGIIGVPVPGVELKLVPTASKLEVRVRGPNVMPGYWKQPELTKNAFDDEGFYQIGDAVEFADPERPEKGLIFNGRVGEDFKLSSGTWVHVGSLRMKGIEALLPIAQDIVITGHDRDEIGFLIFPNVPELRKLSPHLPADASVEELLIQPSIHDIVARGLAKLKKEGGGSSGYAARAMLLAEPLSIDAGEITDKAYVNQRMVLTRRADFVLRLHADQPDRDVILPARTIG
uniref:feruloyl-CoA synthase n=1 Tax=Castellaniella defragrans TaxID=75697 RepID=UPI0033408497